MEPPDLPRRSRVPGPGQPVSDAVVPADPAGQHLPALPGTVSRLLAVVREHLAGNPEPAQRGGERQARRPARGPGHDLADHAEPRVIIHARDQPGLGPVGQEDPAHQVHLPQRHRGVPLPPHIAVPRPLAGPRVDQPAADQDPAGTHRRRHRRHARPAQLVRQPQRTTPARTPAAARTPPPPPPRSPARATTPAAATGPSARPGHPAHTGGPTHARSAATPRTGQRSGVRGSGGEVSPGRRGVVT